jgi:hypothetical protein
MERQGKNGAENGPAERPRSASGGAGQAAKTLLQNLALALGALVFAFLLCELALRLLTRPEPPDEAGPVAAGFMACRRDSTLGWVLPADSSGIFQTGGRGTAVRTNALGLRSPPLPAADEPGLHVLVIGDSYAFGWGVPDSLAFPHRLEILLRESNPGLRVSVINAGMPGFSILQQLRMLNLIRAHTRVDVVVSTYSLANDPVDELRIARFAPDRLAAYNSGLRDSLSVAARIIRSSRMLSWIDRRTTTLQFAFANLSPPALGLARRSLENLCAAGSADGGHFLLVVLPRRGEIVADRGIEGWLTPAAMTGARRLPSEVALSRRVPVLDVTPTLRGVQEHEPAFLPADAHWTPAGHEAVARAIARALPEAWIAPRIEG